MASKVIVHVGAPKTGTSFVQNMLFTERDELRTRGILYPADRFDAHFLAALDLMQLPWGGLEEQALGRWDWLSAQVRAWPHTAIISHEILANASRGQVARALESLDAEIHIAYSARDLARQIPAEWQENLKHRRTLGYEEFLEELMEPTRTASVASWFWGVQEIPDVLDRWGSTLPRKQVHLVTVPPPGAAHEVLWERFSSVLGLDPREFRLEETRANASLGVAEAALLRRLNEHVAEVVTNRHYRPLVREHLVHQNLSHESASARLSVPPRVWRWAHELSRQWVAEVALRGYDVVGELDDLIPIEPTDYVDPDHPDEAEVADAGLRALTAMTREAARLRDTQARLEAEITDLARRLDDAHSTRIYQAKERLVARADTSWTASKALAVYRRLRRRNSRPA